MVLVTSCARNQHLAKASFSATPVSRGRGTCDNQQGSFPSVCKLNKLLAVAAATEDETK